MLESRPRGGFAAAIARSGAAPRARRDVREAAAAPPRRRGGETPAALTRGGRWRDPPRPSGALPIPERPIVTPASPDPRATAAPAPIAPAALDRIATIARVQRYGAALELSLGPDLSVHLSRGPSGVELLVDVHASLAAWAEVELPRMLSALRARGVTVARGAIRRARQAGRAALTVPRGSATRAPSSPAHGTVAKW